MVKLFACLYLLLSLPGLGQDGVQKLFEKARLLEERNKDLPEALRLFAEVVRLGKTQRTLAAQAQYERGVILLRLGRKTEAMQAFRAVITEFPQEADLVRQARAKLSAMTPAPGPIVRRLFDFDDDDFVTPSPDGRYIAYTDSASGDLMVRDIVTGELRHVTGKKKSWAESDEQSLGSVFSPSGRRLAYLWQTKAGVELRIINFDGSGDRIVARGFGIRDALFDWSADESSLLARLPQGLAIISATTGTINPATLSAHSRVGNALFSRDGKYVVFDAVTGPDGNKSDIFAVSLRGGSETAIVEHPQNDVLAGWSPDGNTLVFFSDRTGTVGLWGIRVSNGTAQGEPVVLDGETGRITALGISRKGSLFCVAYDIFQDVYTATLDLDAGTLSQPQPANPGLVGRTQHPAWSADGEFLIWNGNAHGDRVISMQSHSNGQIREVHPRLTSYSVPNWIANGRIVVVGTDASGTSGFYSIDAATGEATLLLSEAVAETRLEGAWSPDGRILYNRFPDPLRPIFAMDVVAGSKRELFVPPPGTNIGQTNLTLSPDGTTLAFGLADYPAKGQVALMLMPAAGGAARALITVSASDRFPYGAFAWTPDSRQLVTARKSGLYAVSTADGSTRKITARVHEPMMLRLHPDGKTLAFVQGEIKGHLSVIENFLPNENGTRGK